MEIRERCSTFLIAATDEAARLHHNFIGTEHLYNALTKIDTGMTQRLLHIANLDVRQVRNEIRREAGPGEDEPEDAPPFTPRAHRVLAMSVYHADDYGADQVQEPHLLLALLQEGEGVAVRKLVAMGISIDIWMEMILDDLERAKSGSSDSASHSSGEES